MVRFTAYEHMVHVGVLIYHSYQSPVELRRRRRRRRRPQASPAFGEEEGRRVAYEVMKEIASSVALAAASLDPPASSSSLRFSSLLPLGTGSSREGDARLGDRDEIVRPRVPLEACLASFSAPEEVHDFYSTSLNAKTTAIK
ncbi:hypothetical protein BHM03_00017495 [Ensete ventricosum]|nr:hypothetical protein BHM03_00017495 [Ensete ventricosum]